ncbi:MAG TPA: 50S ribosomal protein L32 [Candidatus Babeliales bacterium]|jgi:large subunit ribosomal protein L32|nr:50S ribosomal protein L32 [Candidatus Babeliales bacterium]
MPVPKRKRSRARRDSRFANKGIKVKAIAGCAQCNEPLIPHSACKKCGFYKGAKVLATKADRKVRRLEVKAAKKPAKKVSEESQAE